MSKSIKSLNTEGRTFYTWSQKNTIGKIPKEVSKEGAGENRIPFTHLANSVPVYLVFKDIVEKSKKNKAFILDIGCGTGRNISFVKETLAKKNYSYYGIDYSTACINFANKQYGKKGVQFMQYQGRSLPFPDESMDYIVSSHVLEHILNEDHEIFFKEISRVLKKGGVAVIGTPNRKYCQDLFAKNPHDEKKYRLVLPHEHEFYYKEIRNLLQNNKNLFSKFSIKQTVNEICRRLMKEGIDKIKPKKQIFHKIKFNIYNFLRSSPFMQDIMAKVGTEMILRSMKVSYKELIAATYLITDEKNDNSDNFIIITQK